MVAIRSDVIEDTELAAEIERFEGDLAADQADYDLANLLEKDSPRYGDEPRRSLRAPPGGNRAMPLALAPFEFNPSSSR